MGITNLLDGLGGLEKMRITAFPDTTFAAGTASKSYLVMYNPTAYDYEYKILWAEEGQAGAPATEQAYLKNKSESISFEFLFDATGASPPGAHVPGRELGNVQGSETINAIDKIREDKHIEGALTEFFNMMYRKQGDTHQPNYLQVNWGSLEFRGVLDTATVSYKLFNSQGVAIRATVSATFKQSTSREEQENETQTNSPDLTHYRTALESSTLPMMTEEIYRDPMLYLEVARTNNLKNFRRLTPGQRIAFYPLEKTTR